MSIFYQNRTESFHSLISVNNTFPPHIHKQLELIFVLSGQITVTVDKKSFLLSRHDLSLCFPSLIHSCETKKESRIFMLIFNPDFLPDFSNELMNLEPLLPCFHLEDDSEACRILYSLLHCQSGKPDNRIVKGYLMLLLGFLFSSMEFQPRAYREDMELNQRLLLYMDSHFKEDLTLEALAKTLGINRFYLSHLFSEKLHTSFPSYLNGKRIDYAMKLLLGSSLSVTEIAYECGFASTRTFYRAFRTITGMTPCQFRLKKESVQTSPL